MKRILISIGMILAATHPAAFGQDPQTSSLLKKVEPLEAGTSLGKPIEPTGLKQQAPGEPTEITATQEANFDQQTRRATFIGAVRVKHPQFTLTSDKLTAILKKEGAENHSGAAAASKTPAMPGGGGLEKVIAEGNVVIVQEKSATEGAEKTQYVAKAAKAEYDSDTGNVTLSGWPQVQQGKVNTQVATDSSTVMILNRDGKMTTTGGSKTLIQDSGTNNAHP